MAIDLRKFFEATGPSKTLVVNHPEDRKYYIDFSSVRGGDIITKLKQKITYFKPDDPTCTLLTGHIGCGKSTELLRLQGELEADGFHVIYFESSEDLEMTDVDIGDVLLAIARRVSQNLEEMNIAEPRKFKELLQGAWNVLKTPLLQKEESTFAPPSLRGKGVGELGSYTFLLAKAQYNLGEKSEAIRNLETARELSEPVQCLRLYLDILQNLQKLYFEEKEYLKAYDIKQEIFSVEQQFGLRAFIGAGRLQSFKGEASSTRYKYDEKVAPEIAASTRQLDVERLIERVGRNDCKLIVIYGQSGVGKSSLVNAGLEPALKNKAIGIKDNLPIVIRVYTNWQEECYKIFQQLAAVNEERIRTVLIFDQFEEFFFVCTEPAQRREFFEFLAKCLNVLSVKVILSLRVDYLHYLLECNDLSSMNIIGNDILSNNVLYKIGNFTPSDAKSIIQRLTHSANFPLEVDLIDKLVEDLAGTVGEVRPIELQIVGSQLQTDNINTLAKYTLLGNKAKEELVKRYLQAVLENCGAENIQLAELLLYTLTDEKGTRPLKTRAELEGDLKELFNSPSGLNLNQLNLVIEILVKSGLVLLLPEKPDDRYQLVHDYIATFLRQQQEPKLMVLMEELNKERQQREELTITGHSSAVISVAWNPDGKTLASVSNNEILSPASKNINSTIKLWDATTGKLNKTITGHSKEVNDVAWNPDGKILASASNDSTIKLWNATTGKLNKTITGHSSAVISVAWNPDGKTLASASSDNTIKLWDVTTGKQMQTLTGHSDRVISVAWNPDGKTLASASDNSTVKLWDATTGKQMQTLTGHSDKVAAVDWNPDGKTLASASLDETIILWDFDLDNLVKSACNRLENYLAFHPEVLTDLKVCQTQSFVARAAEVLVVQGEEQAKNGKIETAVEKFRQAQKWNPQLIFDPETKARELQKQGQGK